MSDFDVDLLSCFSAADEVFAFPQRPEAAERIVLVTDQEAREHAALAGIR